MLKEKVLVLHETQLNVKDGEKGLLLQDPMLRLESDDTNPDDDLDELETETQDRDFQVLYKKYINKRHKN